MPNPAANFDRLIARPKAAVSDSKMQWFQGHEQQQADAAPGRATRHGGANRPGRWGESPHCWSESPHLNRPLGGGAKSCGLTFPLVSNFRRSSVILWMGRIVDGGRPREPQPSLHEPRRVIRNRLRAMAAFAVLSAA